MKTYINTNVFLLAITSEMNTDFPAFSNNHPRSFFIFGGKTLWVSSEGLGADDLTRPSLMLASRLRVGDHHLHCLDLLHLGGDGAHLVRHLVPFHGHVLALNAVSERT